MNRATHAALLALELVLLGAAIALSVVVRLHPGPFAFEISIERAAQGIRWPPLTAFLKLLTWAGWPLQALVIVLCIAVVLLAIRRWLEAVAAVVAGLAVDELGFIANTFVHRPRPRGYGIHPMHLHPGTNSYPSGHVIHYVAFYGFLIALSYTDRWPLWLRRAMLLLLIPIACIGVSRLYEGEHWFLDVLGGYLFGAFWLLLVTHLYAWIRDWLHHRRATAREQASRESVATHSLHVER